MEWRQEPFLSAGEARVVFHWRMTGTMRGPLEPLGFAPTGRSLDAEGIDVFELRDGLVCSYTGFFDARGMAQQIGLMPASGSHAERLSVAAQRLSARIERRRR
jgi:SnoaL-like polyketide cyclase